MRFVIVLNFIAGLLLASSFANAQTFKLQSLSEGDLNKVIDDLSATFTHSSVRGAGTLGHVFGFEFGLIGGLTHTGALQSVVRETDPNASLSPLPNFELLAALSVPLGFTVEIAGLPKVGSTNFHVSTYSLAAKWTANEIVELPVDLAVRVQSTQSHLDANQTFNNVHATYSYGSTITALTLLASKNFILVEPYLGLGVLRAVGRLQGDGVSVFDPAFNASGGASGTRGSTQLLVGAEFKLFVAKLGVEYARLFDTDRYTGKLAFYF